MAGKKISELTGLGGNFADLDIFEISQETGGSFVSRKITGLQMRSSIPSAEDINDLTDALVENNSIWLGNDPSATTSTAEYNVAVGTTALDSITSGDKNVSIGYNALTANTTGLENVAVGSSASAGTTATTYGVFVGCNAGLTGAGAYNVAVGHNAGYTMGTSAIGNTLLGRSAGSSIDSGTYNTLLGFNAGDNLTTGDNNIIIGYAVDASAVGVDNELRIGKQAVIAIGADLATGAVTFNSAYTFPTADAGVAGYVLTSDAAGAVTWAAAGGGGATDLDGLTDVEVTLGAGHAGSAYQYNIFMANGASVGAVPSHGTLSDARANIGMGGYALAALTSGDYNIGIGLRACWKVATTTQNVGIGYSALMNTTGSGNTAIGYDAGGSTSSGGFNTFVGGSAYGVNTSSRQISIGYGSVAGGNDTFALGYLNKTLLHGEFVTGGQTKLGINLGTTWQTPTATLHVKGAGATSGTIALLIEDSAGADIMKLTDAGDNISIGKDALAATTGVFNVGIGLGAGAANVGGNHNVIIGRVAGAVGSMSYCTYIGSGAGNQGGAGGSNTAIGYSAGFYLNSGSIQNTFVGRNSGNNCTGDDNVMMGFQSGQVVSTGIRNTIIGTKAGAALTASNYNSFLGESAAYNFTTGAHGNVAMGWEALRGGAGATGTYNVSIGAQSMYHVTSGSNNISIGNSSGSVLTTGSTNIYIGYNVDASAATVSDELNIGGQIIGSMAAADRYTKFVGQAYSPTATLTSSASITPDFTNGNTFKVTLAHNTALANPTNPKDGATYTIIVTQDGTGSRTMSFGANYKWSGGTAPTLSAAANAVDILTFISDGTNMYGTSNLNFS